MGAADGTWLITGCSTGIGRATALLAARRGADVVATMRRPEAGQALVRTADEEGLRLRVAALDVDDAGSVQRCLDAVGAPDVLVSNAGIAPIGTVEEQDEAEWRRTFETNVFGPLRLVQAVLPAMRHNGHGVIACVSSVLGEGVSPVMGAYAASKHALEAMCEALAAEVRGFGVRVAIVQPGLARSEVARSGTGTLAVDPASPYAAMTRALADGWAAGVDAGAPPEEVAEGIWAAVTATGERLPLRWPVAAMGPMSAAAWLAGVRERRTAEWRDRPVP